MPAAVRLLRADLARRSALRLVRVVLHDRVGPGEEQRLVTRVRPSDEEGRRPAGPSRLQHLAVPIVTAHVGRADDDPVSCGGVHGALLVANAHTGTQRGAWLGANVPRERARGPSAGPDLGDLCRLREGAPREDAPMDPPSCRPSHPCWPPRYRTCLRATTSTSPSGSAYVGFHSAFQQQPACGARHFRRPAKSALEHATTLPKVALMQV